MSQFIKNQNNETLDTNTDASGDSNTDVNSKPNNTAQLVDDYLAKFDNLHSDAIQVSDTQFSEEVLATLINVKRFKELLTESDSFLNSTNRQISDFQ